MVSRLIDVRVLVMSKWARLSMRMLDVSIVLVYFGIRQTEVGCWSVQVVADERTLQKFLM